MRNNENLWFQQDGATFHLSNEFLAWLRGKKKIRITLPVKELNYLGLPDHLTIADLKDAELKYSDYVGSYIRHPSRSDA